MCRNKSHIDIPMVITMVSWFGGIIGYTIYFIRWNQKEIARQSSYLASLDKKVSRLGVPFSYLTTSCSRDLIISWGAVISIVTTTAPY